MKERQILFKGEMVRAILRDIDPKTMTRRTRGLEMFNEQPDRWRFEGDLFAFDGGFEYQPVPKCPYGQPGDHLWVRETWKYWDWTEDGMPWIKYAADDSVEFFDSCIPEEWSERIEQVWAELSAVENYQIDKAARDHKWRPSLFMPRWASRIDLEITNVRIERLQDISEADAKAEGTTPSIVGENLDHLKYRAGYLALWETVNGPGSWDANPWVWVIEFRRIRP